MEITFRKLKFNIDCEKVYLSNAGGAATGGGRFCEVQICGENKDTHMGAKMASSSEGKRLVYVSHTLEKNRLEITQRSELIEVRTVFDGYDGINCVRVHSEIKNISGSEIILEEASAFVLPGIGARGIDSAESLYFTRFAQSHHAECQPYRYSFKELGLFRGNAESQKRIGFANVGSWSTKEEIPQGIIEDGESGSFLMFQIESNASWYYEIADSDEKYYLWLGGATLPFGGWSKALAAEAVYNTVNVAISFGASESEVIAEMTGYRRHIAAHCSSDSTLPTIFNEYMHLSWDSPTEENTRSIAPIVAKCGVEYYVIDCGWHNEEPGCEVYPYVGQWHESKARFPHGVRATTDFIRSLGMKAGLWIEPEIIGVKCKEMLEYYDDDCFMQRNGRRIAVMNRHFLDFRAPKVREYMSETIRRMVEDYGADYIKCDYNEDCGVGTDYLALCAAEGLEVCASAYLEWMSDMVARYPNVVFEGCASGGMRMDYKTLSVFSLLSTSDQVNYLKYPYIAGNILSAVIPEQAAVWSYPVGCGIIGLPLDKDADWVQANTDADKTAMNMINSFLGRMHLASHIELLSEECLSLVKEGVDYYNKLTEVKKRAVPYFPNGFTRFGADNVVSGIRTDDKIYLAVWCLDGSTNLSIRLEYEIKDIKIAYPTSSPASLCRCDGGFKIEFTNTKQAVFVEICV